MAALLAVFGAVKYRMTLLQLTNEALPFDGGVYTAETPLTVLSLSNSLSLAQIAVGLEVEALLLLTINY